MLLVVKRMSKIRRILCCVSKNKEPEITRDRAISDEVFLLPGGEWDPSLSRSNSRGFKRLNTKSGHYRDQSERDGLYQPPTVAPSKVLPTFEDFKLLKTVGRGAFGKASFFSRAA